MRVLTTFFLLPILFFYGGNTYADAALLRQKAVQQFIHKMVREHHFEHRQLVAIMKEAVFQPQIIESMERPYEKKNWDVYKDLFLTSQRVQAGLDFWHLNQQTLAKAEKEYGVPAEIIVAIIGVETLYGQRQGTYRVLDALTTLAFYYPKRADFFTKELGEYLLLCREQGIPANKWLGSYAGAMGKPQFMPSSYRFYAVDYAGHGKRDLMNDDRDVIGSVANYFHQHGWQKNMDVVEPADVQGWGYRRINTNLKTADYAFKQLMALGVKPKTITPTHPHKAGLLEFTTQQGQEYWLAYPNFYVITRYNSSPQYALVVYLLAQQLYAQRALTT